MAYNFAASAQVGVNNPDPEQALDVSGKIRVTDDATLPSNGTIRYNDSEQSFEGFTNGEWQTFNKAATPENVDFRQIYETSSAADGNWKLMRNQASPTSGFAQSITSVPSGKKFLVTMVECVARDEQPNEFFYACVSPSRSPFTDQFGLRNPRIYLSGNSNNGNTVVHANRTPLMTIHAGDWLAVWNSSNSQTSLRIVVTGFMVDADATDDYFSY
ncbi:hypothetical protein A3850_018775 [Lewinella sp. 4G2]|nr:hypothetical protein A3850_018775 [Lewinella sp. 4G2]